LQFSCHAGHADSPESLLADHALGLECALGSAVRIFDKTALVPRLALRQLQSLSAGSAAEARSVTFETDAEAIR